MAGLLLPAAMKVIGHQVEPVEIVLVRIDLEIVAAKGAAGCGHGQHHSRINRIHLLAEFRQRGSQVDVIAVVMMRAAITTSDRIFPVYIEAVENPGSNPGAAGTASFRKIPMDEQVDAGCNKSLS